MNIAIVCGNLGKDPEIRETKGGTPVANFSVATKKFVPGANGAKGEERTEWHNIIVWGNLAKSCAQYLSKGKMAGVQGELATRQWVDKAGVKHYTTEIIAHQVKFLSPRDAASAPPPMEDTSFPQSNPAQTSSAAPGVFGDDIPFARLNEWGM